MDVPIGNYVSRVLKTQRFEFPSHVESIAVDFIPVLELTYKAKQVMKEAVSMINKRKRKVVELGSLGVQPPSISFSFVRGA